MKLHSPNIYRRPQKKFGQHYPWASFHSGGRLTTHKPAAYVWVSDQSSVPMFCPKKLISQPREVQNPPNLTQGTLTQYVLRLVILRPHPTPPICLKMPKCAKFCTFGESRFKHTPKVGVHRENLLMGNVAQTFFGAFYICWDYVISFSQHFPMRKFSPSPSTSPSPESHLLLQNLQKFRKYS